MMNKIFVCLFLAVSVLGGCTRYDNPQPNFEEYEQGDAGDIIKRKVLVIAVDGLVGNEIKREVPANLSAMLANSKYSFDGLADEDTSDPASWATLMTGVGVGTHHIETDSYIPSPDPEHPHDDTGFSPSFFYLINEQNRRMSTVAITQDRNLSFVLLMDAKESLVAETDELARDKAIEKIQEETADVVLVQFTSVLEAGKTSSFSYDSPAYKAAVEKVDGFIGELKNTVESRATYDQEEWLIVVASTHGGVGNSYGGSSELERNTFLLYYNRHFGGQELQAQPIYAPRFFGYNTADPNPTDAMRARNATAPAGEADYNIAKTGVLTIEAKVKMNKNASGNYSYSWPPFLSKVNARSGTTAGWSFFRSGDGVNFYVADGATKIEINGAGVGINEIWSQVTGVFSVVDGEPTAKIYVNGNLAGIGTANLNVANITSSSPLTLGFQGEVFSSAYLDFYMADVRIWDIALTEKEVMDNVKFGVGIPENHPKIAHLVGYWPLDDGDNVFKNKVAGKPDIPVVGPAVYRMFGNNMPSVDPRKSALLKSQDLPTQILYWLELDVNEDWKLEGNNFLRHFEIEFIR